MYVTNWIQTFCISHHLILKKKALNILNNIRLALINPDRAMRGLEVILRQSTRITATQLTNLIKGLTPFVEDCLKYPRVVNRLFYIFNIFLTLKNILIFF